jgi:hypothetical protein
MSWRLFVSGLLMLLTTSAFARCENLSGLERLACEKSAHKIKGGASSQPSANANASNAGRRIANAIDPEKPSKSGKKAKLRLPNNRKTGPREHAAHERAKKQADLKMKAKTDKQEPSLVSSASVNPLTDAGLVNAGSVGVLSSDAGDSGYVLPSQGMLASDVALDSAPSTIGDDALYRIY